MSSAATSVPSARTSLLRPILVGGALAGTLDLTAAFISFGPGVPRAIAGGLVGRVAFDGGAGTWILGVILHYFIAFSAAAIYCFPAAGSSS